MARVLVSTGEKIPAYIGRCVKCRKTYRWDVPADVRITNPHIIPSTLGVGRGLPLVAVMPRCTAHIDGLDRPSTHWIKFRPLNATYRDGIRCTKTCRNATSASCECECGGTNHGRGHTATT